MKLYKITIKPLSNFTTPLKGDTLFGQICWGIRYIFGLDRLNKLLKDYGKEPFLVVSDGFVSGYLPKPKMPPFLLGEDPDKKKINRKKIWISIEDFFKRDFLKAKTSKEVGEDKEFFLVRNSINYKTSTTDEGEFSPYAEKEISLTKKDIYFLIGNQFSLDDLKKVLTFISQLGYGKDTTIGKGRFEIETIKEFETKQNSNTFMSISPCNIYNISAKNIYYETFVRFGKLGYDRAFKNPFKKPIILADSGAVVEFEEKKDIQYIGKVIKDISTYKDVIHQGYAIVLPMGEIQ